MKKREGKKKGKEPVKNDATGFFPSLRL